jgi:transglutaminase-like putative cysteine protease
MVRTALLLLAPTCVLAWNWLRLEHPRASVGQTAWIVLLGVAPSFVRGWRLRAGAALAAFLFAVHSALGVSALDARPFDGRHDFFGPLLSRFQRGFLDFYDVRLPFDRHEYPLMHGVVLFALFVSCLVVALAVAARRPLAAVPALVVAAGWPATLLFGPGDLRRGAFLLGAALVLLVGTRETAGRRLGHTALAGALVILVALFASTSGSVARGGLLDWQSWDFYTRAQHAVGVEYVWNSSYEGIRFPRKETAVLRIKGPARPLYWRATTLDIVAQGRWFEDLHRAPWGFGSARVDLWLLPVAAAVRRYWVRQNVTVLGLRDNHLVGASMPVAYERGGLGQIDIAADGVASAPGGLSRGERYTVWSYVPQPTPAQLARSPASYPPAILGASKYLEVEQGVNVPPFGTPNRDAWLARLFRDPAAKAVRPYLPLYRAAEAVVGNPRNAYAATVELEAWFRSGGFTYDESPPTVAGEPPLVAFVTQTKRGYCQHFAGAMALMLRYLGIPARVAAGFTSGMYNPQLREWTVTDHAAHTWVEVWFRGYGWLPFDPTPSRGTLSAPYTAASPSFDVAQAVRALAADGRNQKKPAVDLRKLKLGPSGITGSLGPIIGHAEGRPPSAARSHGPRLFLVLLLLVAGVVVLITVAKLARRRGRYLTQDPRRLAAACRRELVDFLLDQRLDVPRSATLADLGSLLDSEFAVEASRFVAAANAARFGPDAVADTAAERARRELRTLRAQIRRRLSSRERARGFISVRSLGFAR